MSWETCARPFPWALEDGGYLPERLASPCYLGASYLNCGWAWLYECQAYPDMGSQVCCDWQYWYRGACCTDLVEIAEDQWAEWWPHPC